MDMGTDLKEAPPAYKSSGSITVEPVILQPVQSVGPLPTTALCSRCGKNIVTEIDYKAGACTWLACGLISLTGMILGCCLIPFAVKSCQDVYHYCPECRSFIAVYKRL